MKNDLTKEQLAQPVNVTLPLGAVLRLAETEPRAQLPTMGKYAIVDDCLPAIGQPLEGGIYAGITVHDNAPMALVLLPGDEKKGWKEGLAWAIERDGALPSRFDGLVLYRNLKGEFDKDAWYWTSEEYASDAAFAWIQGFGDGGQHGYHKSYDARCRAVRRVAI